jgi:lysophospholipase L1-like esterase
MLKIARLLSVIMSLFFLVVSCAGGSGTGSNNKNTRPMITATAGVNGAISPAGVVDVKYGSDLSFTIASDSNYYVLNVVVDGVSMGPMTGYTFSKVTRNHTIEANFDVVHQIITLGDSITAGFGDDIAADDISQDGKNTGGGFQPILNNLLTTYEKGFPHDIVNEGVGGDTSADGLAFIATALSLYPGAKSYLIEYGTNDADPMLPIPSGKGLNPGDPGYPGTYKDNLQQIINAINSAGKQVCVAKPPIALGDTVNGARYANPDTGARSVQIKEYNQVVDELANNPSNHLTITPPNFYNYFKEVDPVIGNPRYEDQFTDNFHPNGIGYQSIAELWFEALTR